MPSPRAALLESVATTLLDFRGLPAQGSHAWPGSLLFSDASLEYDLGTLLAGVEKRQVKYWNMVCPDGQIVTQAKIVFLNQLRGKPPKHPSPPWEAVFVPHDDGEHLEFVRMPDMSAREGTGVGPKNDIDDCTHFVSDCLRRAGLTYVPAENHAGRMVKKLVGLPNIQTKTLAVAAGRAAAQRMMALMKKGDVIAYWYKAKESYTHMAVCVGGEGIACHMRCRFGEHWSLQEKAKYDLDLYNYTLIHFSSDDQKLPALGSSLGGWWRVNWRGQNYYYHYERDGRVHYTTLKPAPGMQRILNPQGAGYWFEAPGERHVICWPRTGTFEKFWFGPHRRVMQGFVNDGEPLLSEKL